MTRLFALSDPHLSLATPGKEMDRFGEHWRDHSRTIESRWREVVALEDVVLIPGDISWAMRLPQALADLEFLGRLPGRKVILRGNHDYWWSSLSKVRHALPAGMYAVDGDAVEVGPFVIGGTRLWDIPGVSFADFIDWTGDRAPISAMISEDDVQRSRRIYEREMGRLRRAMQDLSGRRPAADRPVRVALTHYPPCSADLSQTDATLCIEASGASHCVFGHLHSVRRDRGAVFGRGREVEYHLTSCDFLDFRPKLIAEAAP